MNVSIRINSLDSGMVATKIPSLFGEVTVTDGWPWVARDPSVLIVFVELSGTLAV